MSYGGPTYWVSPRTWIRIFNAFTGQNLPYPKANPLSDSGMNLAENAIGTAQSLREYLLVHGEQTGEGDWVLYPAYELDYPVGTDDEPGEGEYSIALRGAGGEELFVRRFPLPLGHIDTLELSGLAAPLSFVELLPLPDGTTTIELRQGEVTVAIAEVSPHAPAVEILSPTSGGFEGQPDAPRIRWIGHDDDDDLLRYMVRYRPNDGAEWQTLATDWTTAELAVNLADLPGGNTAMVQVLATDGFNTGVATSPAFVVAGKPPQVQILMPAEATTIQEGDLLVLRGAASDLEDELLEDTAFTWSSHHDGPLGTGRRIETTALSPGTYTITLAAGDSDGQVGTATVTVEVTERLNTQPIAGAGPDQTASSGCGVTLDSSGSVDPDGDELIFVWSVVTQPDGSEAWFSDPEGRTTGFFADRAGDYEIELNVHDGQVGGHPDRVTVHVTGQGAEQSCLYLPLLLRPGP
jgi:hypothetical protein